jgi:hypothetical protein
MHQSLKAVGLDLEANHWSVFEIVNAYLWVKVIQVVFSWINEVIDCCSLVSFGDLNEDIDWKSKNEKESDNSEDARACRQVLLSFLEVDAIIDLSDRARLQALLGLTHPWRILIT